MKKAAAVPTRRRGDSNRLWLIGLALLALALRLYGIQSGLPEVFEEAYPFKTAWTMWGFGPGRHFDLNPHWFKYPGLTLYLQWLGQALLYTVLRGTGAAHSLVDYRVLHELDPTPFFLVGRSITALLGAATVVPVFLLARRVAGGAAARAAALLVAISPILIARSQVIEVDVPLTLFAAWALLAAVEMSAGLSRRRVILAAVMTGLAIASKYPGLVLVVPCAVAIGIASRPRAEAATAGSRTPSPAADTGALGALALFAAVMLGTVFITSPYLFLDARAAWADLGIEREHMRVGHFGSDLGAAWLSYVRDWFGSVAGVCIALAGLAGFVRYAVMERRPWALVAGSFVVAYAALVSSFAMKADRYLLPLLPAGIVFACALAAELAERWTRPRAAKRVAPRPDASAAAALRRRERLAMVGLTAVLALPFVAGFPAHLASLGPDTRTSAGAWIQVNLSAGSFVACEPYGPRLTSPLEIQGIDRDLLPALQKRGFEPRLYAVQSIPMFQVGPERSAAFYDPSLYRVADAFVVTGAVRDRYRHEPARFAAQLALYDTLEQHWIRWRVFSAGRGPGSEIVIYRNPAQTMPFAGRRPDPGPLPELRVPAPTGGEAYFLYNLGLNYEVFGFRAQALPAFVRGIEFAATEPAQAAACAERAALLLERLGRRDEAVKLLDRAAAEARPSEAARIRGIRDRL